MQSPSSDLATAKDIISIISGVVVIIAAIIGGLWAWRRYRKERLDEPALDIEIDSTCAPYGADSLIFLVVTLTNKGKTMIEAKNEQKIEQKNEAKNEENKEAKNERKNLRARIRDRFFKKGGKAKSDLPNGLVFMDEEESLKYSGSLKIKKVEICEGLGMRNLDWFGQHDLLKPVDNLPEINLLTEYETPTERKIEFWMEPGESYHLGVAIVLPPGLYLAKATFVGAGGNDVFWSRLHSLQVPERISVAPASHMKGSPERQMA